MKTDCEIAEEMIGLLRDKKKLFEEFEAVTEQMMTDSFEEIERILDCVEQRERLKEQVDGLDQKLGQCAMQSSEGESLIRASRNLCNYSELRQEFQPVFSAGQEIFRIISRIQNAEPQISKNMETMREALREKIKENKKNTKFTGYMNNMGLQASKGALYDKKR